MRLIRVGTVVLGVAAILSMTGTLAAAAPPRTSPLSVNAPPQLNAKPSPPEGTVDQPDLTRLAEPDKVLPKDWRASKDRAIAVTGDLTGLHLLVADEAAGYQWRTAATLADNTFDTDRWIGQACVTGSGDRAVVVYAPRGFTNSEAGMYHGGLVAIVDLRDGAVKRLDVHASLAYDNPGCGAGETATIATHTEKTTSITLIDAATGKTTAVPAVPGQVTSAVPTAGGTVASLGTRLVSIAANGTVTTLSTEKGVPFRLHPDRSGGVAYEVVVGSQAEVRRFAGKGSTLLGTGGLRDVRLSSVAGNVFVLGKDRTKVNLSAAPGWTALDAPVQAQPSTTGTLVVTNVGRADGKEKPQFDRAQRVKITATATASKAATSFQLQPAAGRHNSPPAPATPKNQANSLAPGNDPTDPDAACAVARNDDKTQSYQATAAQVEWAVDLAVKGLLTISRPQNSRGSGTAPYKIQGNGGIFPLHTLQGGGAVPAQVLLGALAQESNTMHASPHLVDGETGNVNQGGFYGDWVSWDTADCGYGVGQMTTGMSKADGTSVFTPLQQKAIATDYAANIAASVNMLIDKWNLLWNLGIKANTADTRFIENWYLAAWAYNTGLQPNAANGNTTGCAPSPSCTDGQSPGHWGLGWLNNPGNTIYPADRLDFDGQDDYDTIHPNLWPYPEKVVGFAYRPVARYSYANDAWQPAYQSAAANIGYPDTTLPRHGTFCVVAINQCTPSGTTDDWGTPGAALCNLSDLHCWWHNQVNWVLSGNCAAAGCGVERITYGISAVEPSAPSVYPPACGLNGLPGTALIVDDTTVANPIGFCNKGTSGGSFGWTFAQKAPGSGCSTNCISYESKIDFHQIGNSGFGGHFWFTHTVAPADQHLKITGTWTLNPTNKWTRLFVHIPPVGAMTHQARYDILLPNGQAKYRVIPTSYEADTWVDIGVYDMRGTTSPKVSLSNVTNDGTGSVDVAWDALAYVTLDAKPANFVVALGDSYSSGEGNGDYYHVTDQYGDTPEMRNACRRSPHAWSRQVKLPGQSQNIGTLADSANPALSYAFAACSGARTWNVASANEPWNAYGGEAPHGSYGELPQLDQGLLDENTTMVMLTIGGNDAGFTAIANECGRGACPPEADIKAQILAEVKPRVQAIVAQIRARAANALIVFAGYPRLFNDGAALDSCLPGLGTCEVVQGLGLSMSAAECAMLNRISDFIAANVLPSDLDHGVLGVSVYSTFYGHAITAWASSDYINTVVMPNASENGSGEEQADLWPIGNLIGMGSFHPTSDGSAFGYGTAVTDALAVL